MLESNQSLLHAIDVALTSYARQDPTEVSWVDSLTDCAVEVHKEEGWVKFGRQGYRRALVSAGYVVRALASIDGCPRLIDGLVTLGAQRATSIEGDDGETIWSAVWARQAKGAPARDAGYIVRRGGAYAHAATVGAARAVLSRRAGAEERIGRIGRWLDAVRSALVDGRLNGYDVAVVMADARRAGLCEAGILAWCARHGIDAAGATTVGHILSISDQREMVLAACLSAIRRQCRPAAEGGAA
jgi:hypothetical protein